MSHDTDKNLFPKFWELDLFMHQSLSLKGWWTGVTKIQEFFVKCIIENGTKSGIMIQ